jgi:hypothetical protein
MLIIDKAESTGKYKASGGKEQLAISAQ